jgi:GTP-binding protein
MTDPGSPSPPRSASGAAPPARVVDASFVAGAVDPETLPPPTLVEVAFAGRSNVGKSTLLNALMERRGLARTSNTPGCTRQLNVFAIRCADGLALHFVDLPGYGWARRSKTERLEWQRMIEGYLLHRVALRAVVLIVDVRRGIEEEEQELAAFLSDGAARGGKSGRTRPAGAQGERSRSAAGGGPEVILVATKMDKLGAARRKPALEAVRRAAGSFGGKVIGFSGATGDGRDSLWTAIRNAAL